MSFPLKVKLDSYAPNCVLLIMLAPATVMQGGWRSVGGWCCVCCVICNVVNGISLLSISIVMK